MPRLNTKTMRREVERLNALLTKECDEAGNIPIPRKSGRLGLDMALAIAKKASGWRGCAEGDGAQVGSFPAWEAQRKAMLADQAKRAANPVELDTPAIFNASDYLDDGMGGVEASLMAQEPAPAGAAPVPTMPGAEPSTPVKRDGE